MKSFITVLNGVVTGKHQGDINNDLFGSPYFGHEKIPVPFEAQTIPLEPITFYTPDWKRKSNEQLIKEKLLPMPQGHVWEGDELRQMTKEERVLTGLDKPQPGYKVENGKIIQMTLLERLESEQISKAEYNRQMTVINSNELNNRLSEWQTPESLALAEIDEEYSAERKNKLKALLAVKNQPGWPVNVEWAMT